MVDHLGSSPWKKLVQEPGHNTGAGAVFDEQVMELYEASTAVALAQYEVAQKCMQLLCLPPGQLLLNIGCGSGMCGRAVADSIGRHQWVGTDIAAPMLRAASAGAGAAAGATGAGATTGVATDAGAATESSATNTGAGALGLVQQDMGQVLPFRPCLFDGAISVSAVHWLLMPGAGLKGGSGDTRSTTSTKAEGWGAQLQNRKRQQQLAQKNKRKELRQEEQQREIQLQTLQISQPPERLGPQSAAGANAKSRSPQQLLLRTMFESLHECLKPG